MIVMRFMLKNNEVISTFSFISLENSVLLINSDLYKTGSRLGKVNIPDVIKNLDEVPFLVRVILWTIKKNFY